VIGHAPEGAGDRKRLSRRTGRSVSHRTDAEVSLSGTPAAGVSPEAGPAPKPAPAWLLKGCLPLVKDRIRPFSRPQLLNVNYHIEERNKMPGADLLSRRWHYHRPRRLNGRVRNGDGWGPPGNGTGPGRCGEEGAGHRRRSAAEPAAAGTGPGGPGGDAVKRSAVSTGRLSGLPRLHLPPIDLVVCQEPTPQRGRRPVLAGGFTLRCLQRLSGPHLATQRCPERDNWHTSGASLPVLSY
jgi:hypothetical protein